MATNAATYDTQTLSTPKLLVDGVVWDGKDPAKYAASFKIKA